MIDFTNMKIFGLESALRGMRNPHQSHDKSSIIPGSATQMLLDDNDTTSMVLVYDPVILDANDINLAIQLVKAGEPHCKFRRMIHFQCDITAPRYWWIEFDTYKIGTVSNSDSTRFTLKNRPLTINDFDIPNYNNITSLDKRDISAEKDLWDNIINNLNYCIKKFKECKSNGDYETAKMYNIRIRKMLPQSYLQHRTVDINFTTLSEIYRWRKGHEYDEWNTFCGLIERLPYSWIITGEFNNGNDKDE